MAANTTNNLSDDTTIINPFPGPVPFNRKYSQFFFGREGEKIELTSMIVANRVVFLYAQSGAGKTSLLNASLLPSLIAEGFDVLPVVRPGIPMPKGISPSEVKNVFAFNTLRAWTKDANPRSLLTKDVADFLAENYAGKVSKLAKNESRPPARIIVLDQFEEIFTTYAERWKDREDFFLQLADALDPDPDDWKDTVKRLGLTGLSSEADRTIRILFVLREDYLASLHSYADLLPIRPAARVRIERLRRSAACEAVEKPAALVNKPFVKGVACGLVEKLLENRVEATSGEVAAVEGEFVEPVQLQIVCKKLLESLPPNKKQIDSDDVKRLGDVNEPLASFYDEAVRDAANKSGEKESALRDWFEYSLITPAGTRGTVFRDMESQKADGIVIEAVEQLDKSHLVRGEMRAGGLWYELTHDRFIEPILLANKRWRDARSDDTKRKLESKATEWSESGADKSKLLNEDELKEAESWITTPQAKELGYSPILVAFMQASRAELDRKKTRRLRRLAVALAVLIVLAMASAGYAYYTKGQLQAAKEELDDAYQKLRGEYEKTGEQKRNAEELARIAEKKSEELRAANELAEEERLKALEQTKIAEDERRKAQEQARLADIARNEAEKQRGIAEAAQKKAEEQEILAKAAKGEAEKQAELARDAKSRAERLSRISDARALAAESRAEDEDPLKNVNLAISAIRKTSDSDKKEEPGTGYPQREVVIEAIYALQAALSGALLEEYPFRSDSPDPRQDHRITSLGFSQLGPDQTSPVLISVSADGEHKKWDTASGKSAPSSPRLKFDEGEKPSNATISPDGNLAAFPIKQNVGSEKEDKVAKWIKVFDLTGNANPITVKGHARGVHKLALSDDGKYLATANDYGNYKITEINLNGKSEEKWAKPNLMEKLRVRFGDQLKFLGIKGDRFRMANALAFSHNSGNNNEKILLATGFQDGRVVIRDAETGKNDIILPEGSHSDSILAMAFSRDNKFLVVSSRDDELIVWNIGSKSNDQPLASGQGQTNKNDRKGIKKSAPQLPGMVISLGRSVHKNPVTSIAFSKDGKYMATGSEDRTVVIWRVQEGFLPFMPAVRLPDHTAQITALAFSPDSQQLATVAADNKRRVWDISSLNKLMELKEGLLTTSESRNFKSDGTADADGLKIDKLIQDVNDLLKRPKKKN